MSGKCRPSLRPKTLYNVDRSSLSTTDKECIHSVFELADHQKSEIERLEEQVNVWQEEADSVGCANEWLKASLKTTKAEAIKEFAEKLKAECRQGRYAIQTSTKFGVVDKQYLRVVDESDIDNLVKEMVGDTE